MCHDTPVAAQWRCSTGHCIPANFVCDQKNDCPNGEDEAGCAFEHNNAGCSGEAGGCDSSEDECANGGRFKCRLSGCVEAGRVCDGHNDCADYSDEAGCAEIVGDVLTIR